jgi:gliding motility-associated-like protein
MRARAFLGSGFFYDTYTLVNSGLTDRCVTIASSATCQGGDEYFVSAYNGTFDPNNICTNYLSDEGVGGQTFSVNIAAGTSVILVVNQVNTGFAGCNSYTLNITGLTPVVTITPSGPTTFCSYDNVDLQAAGANTYVWNTGATGDLITVNGTNTYIVTGTDVNGCTAQASQAVTVNAAPAPNLGGPYVQCSGGSVTLDAGVYASYQWNDASTNQTLTVSSNGTYSVIVTDNNGCTGFSSADVTFSSPPPVNMTGTTELCAGATGTVQVTTAAASYLWNTGSTSSSITVNTPGTYTVTITDVSTCTGSGSWVVSASGNFSVTGSLAAGDNIITGARMSLDGIPKNCGVNVCPGATGPAGVYYDSYSIVNHGPTAMCATASLNATCGGNIFAAAYLTTFNPGSVCANYIADKGNAFAGTTFSFTIPANSTVIVVVSETQGGHPGCGSYTLNVTGVTANVTITPSGSTTLCSYQSVNLTAGGANTYVWNTGPTTPTISVNTTNTYTVTGTDFNGCTASASRSVVVNSAPTPSLGGPYTQCGGFVVLDPGFYLGGYLWNDGTGSQVKLAMSTGTYAVTVTDGNGCTGSASANVTIHPLPVVDLGGPYEQCQGTVTLDAGNPGSSYIWNDGVTTTQTQVASTTGDYQVTVTDNNNCTASGATFVTIDLPPLNTTGYTICQGSQVPAGQGLMASGCGDVSPSFAGRITLADPTFHRSNVGTTYTPSNVGTAVHYVTHPFAVGTSGSYTFTLCGNFDAYLHIYTDPFNPAFPGTNFLAADDDAAICAGGSEITLNLAAGVQYVFVASGYGNNDVGNYTGTFTGPGPVYEGAINAPVWFGQSTGGPLLGTGSPFNPVGTSAVPNTNTPGTYTLYVACPNTPDCRTPVDFVIDPSPTINLGGPYNQCGGSVTLNAGPGASYTYSWTDGATTQTTVATTSGNYGVTVTNGFTCSATADVDVYIQNVPVVNLGLDRTQCGGTVTLDAGNPGNQFIWSDGSTNQTLTVAFGGIYSVTVGDAFTNCTASDGVNVTINQPPVVNLGGPYQQCGGSVTLDAGNVGSTYVWSTGVVTQTITVTNSGTYRVTVTNANTCSATGSANVTIDQYPTLGPDKADSVCPGFTVDLRTYYANTYASYNWSAANPAAAGPGTYTLIVATGAGCADTAMVVITERQHPDLGPDIADSICIGYTFDLWTLYPNNASYTSYVWNTPTPQQVTAGTYTLVVTNASGCMDTVVATITNRQQPSLGPDQADSVCMGFTVDLTTYFPDNGYATYVWNTATPDSVGPGVYQLIVSYGSGCSDTAIMTVIQRQQPVVTLTMAHEMCYTDPAFTLTGGLPVGGIYVINDTLTTFTFDPVALGIGIHRINYIYTNASGCTDSAQVLFTVHPQPNITTIAPPDLCTGSTAIDLDNYFTPLGGVYSGFGVSQHFFYPSITGPVDSNIITYLYTDQFGCKDTSLYPITVKGTVHVSMNVSEVDYTICQGDSITFTASGAEMYEFFINGVSQGVDSVNVLTTTTLNNHDEIFVVGSNSCSSDTSDDVFIDVITLPTVDAGPDTAINLGESIVLTTKATGTGLLLYQWDPNYFLNFTNVPNPTFNGPDTTTFTVRVTDTYGCWGSDTITVNVIIPDNILLPNVMTPDGDGKNDIWKLNPKINLDGSHLIIFNRWGETVYEADSYTNDWDGTYKGTGKKLPDDTYYYVLKVPAQNNHLYKGAINILNGSK